MTKHVKLTIHHTETGAAPGDTIEVADEVAEQMVADGQGAIAAAPPKLPRRRRSARETADDNPK